MPKINPSPLSEIPEGSEPPASEALPVVQAGAVSYFESTGEVPPGCSFDAEHEESFVKPDLIAVATEAV